MHNQIDLSSGYCSANGVFYPMREAKAELMKDVAATNATAFVLNRPERGRRALVDARSGVEMTYAQLRRSVKAVADGLQRLGVKKGDVVLVVSSNFLHFPALALAIMSTGAIFSTANPLYTSLEMQKQMEDSHPVLVFTTPDLLHNFKGTGTRIVVIGPEEEYWGHFSLTWMVSLNPGEKRELDVHIMRAEEEAAAVLYSSGTTGRSKGVISTHRNLIAMTTILSSVIESPRDVYLFFIPLFHIYGFVTLCGVLAAGGTVVMLSNFTVESMLMAVDKYRVTHIPTVPTVITRLCKSPSVACRYDLSCVKQVMVGGAGMGKEHMDTFKALFPTIGILQLSHLFKLFHL